jgi:hypothetical protein
MPAHALANGLSTTDQMRTQQQLMTQLAETQGEVRPLLTRLAELARSGGFGIDESSRNHLRNVDLQMNRLLEELTTGRQVSVQELTREIRMVARTIAAIAEGERRGSRPWPRCREAASASSMPGRAMWTC